MVSQMLGEVGSAAICQYDQRQLDEPATAIIAAEHSGVATSGQRLPLACHELARGWQHGPSRPAVHR
jgi:hypothetical protein